MAFADGYSEPFKPAVFPVYLGFYVLPGNRPVPNETVRVDYFYATSSDGALYTDIQLLENTTYYTGLYVSHSELDPNTDYAYQYQYVFSDGSKTELSDVNYAGKPQQIITTTINLEQIAPELLPIHSAALGTASQTVNTVSGQALAPGVYADITTGVVTIGTLLGTNLIGSTFQTSQATPLVQMDQSGLFALDHTNTQTFFLSASDGSLSTTGAITSGGTINGTDITGSTVSGTTITGGTIIGSTIESGSSNPKAAFDSTGFYVTDGSGNKLTTLTTTGFQMAEYSSANPYDFRLASGVSWIDGGGTVQGFVQGRVYGGIHSIALGLAPPLSGGGLPVAEMFVDGTNFGRIGVQAGVKSAVVLEATNKSTFLNIGDISGIAKYSVAGATTAGFFGSNSSAVTISVTGASGSCHAVANSNPVGILPTICDVVDNGNGTVTITVYTVTLGNTTGTATLHYLAWGT